MFVKVIRVFIIFLENAIDQTFAYSQMYCRIAMADFYELQQGSYLMEYFLFYLILGNILNMQYKIT